MNIIVEFDRAFMTDQQLFSVFIEKAQALGHDVIVVAQSLGDSRHRLVIEELDDYGVDVDVVFGNGLKSFNYQLSALEFSVDLWIGR